MNFFKLSGVLIALICGCWTLTANADDNGLPTPSGSAQDLDQIAAVVNNLIITQNQLERAILHTKAQMIATQTPVPSDAELRKTVLNGLIDEKIQLELAKNAGITTTEKQVDEAIERVAKQNNLSSEQLMQRMLQEGYTKEEYRSAVRNQIIVNQVQMSAVGREVSVKPEEVTQFLEQYKNSATQKLYHVVDILIADNDNAKAESVLKKMRSGAELSQITEGEVNDLDFRPLNALPDIFASKVANMKVNNYVGPIRAPNGLHVIGLLEIKGQANANAGPTRAQAEQIVFGQKLRKAAEKWLAKMRESSYIKVTNP